MLLSADSLETLHRYARIPVVFGSWLESMLQVKNKDFISWHGRIPPRKDSISLRLSHLVVESLTSKVYLQKPVKDPGGAVDTSRYLCTCTYIVRLRLRTGFNADRLLESAREFGRSISLETHYRCLDAMTQPGHQSAARATGQESKEACMFLDHVWDGIKIGSLTCLCAFGIYCMVVGAITTVDQLAAHITAECEKGDQHGTE